MRAVNPLLFPNVFQALERAGIDAQHDLVPVAPAAHYMMGGIATDLDARATLAGLYAVGECSCTGLHGANRLASNSLTECFVFGARAALAAIREPPAESDRAARPVAPGEDESPVPGEHQSPAPGEHQSPAPTPATRDALWENAGLERDAAGLEALLHDPHPLARLIAQCALTRRESRGAHRRRDYPATDPALDGLHVTVKAGEEPEFEAWR
jgi:L-aspartate oxidase